jgi:hypothetical protein
LLASFEHGQPGGNCVPGEPRTLGRVGAAGIIVAGLSTTA